MTIRPFLMFQKRDAEEAMRFYMSLFPNSEVVGLTRWAAGQPGAEGTIMAATFTIAGQHVMCSDSPVQHAFDFTPSMSLFVELDSEQEIERVCTALLDGGQALMPLGSYGFSRKFAWINDRFGVSWQLNVA